MNEDYLTPVQRVLYDLAEGGMQHEGSLQKQAITWEPAGQHADGCPTYRMKTLTPEDSVQAFYTDHRTDAHPTPEGRRIQWKVTKDGEMVAGRRTRDLHWLDHDVKQALDQVNQQPQQREAGKRGPTSSVYQRLYDVISAGRPDLTIKDAKEIDPDAHYRIVGSERPQFEDYMGGRDGSGPRIYAHPSLERRPDGTSVKNYGFLAPVEGGWLRGSAWHSPDQWKLYPEHELDAAIAGPRAARKPVPAEERYYERGMPSGLPTQVEGDVPLDDEGHQVITPYREDRLRQQKRRLNDAAGELGGFSTEAKTVKSDEGRLPKAEASSTRPWWTYES